MTRRVTPSATMTARALSTGNGMAPMLGAVKADRRAHAATRSVRTISRAICVIRSLSLRGGGVMSILTGLVRRVGEAANGAPNDTNRSERSHQPPNPSENEEQVDGCQEITLKGE